MKQRLITAGIGLVVLFLVLLIFNTVFFNLVISIVAVIAVLEVLSAAGLSKERFLLVATAVYTALIPLLPHKNAVRYYALLAIVYIFMLFAILLLRHRDVPAIKIGFSFFVATVLPFSITVVLYIRDRLGTAVALFFVLVALSGAWVSDSGAYFVGRAFGKHKLAPEISPNKTVEGAVGGVVVCILGTLLIAVLYSLFAGIFFGLDVKINYLLLILVMPVISVAGMLGDLTASVVKRQTGVKDFGSIMPGHGGVMDRFDSVFFTAPTVFIISEFLRLITVA